MVFLWFSYRFPVRTDSHGHKSLLKTTHFHLRRVSITSQRTRLEWAAAATGPRDRAPNERLKRREDDDTIGKP